MSNVPKIVFIVPYRNRPQHKYFFSNYLTTIMEKSNLKNDYEVYFSHQCDVRSFNRGATKNIGFLAVKAKYPQHYKEITFVFNDIDTIPFAPIFDFETVAGIVKHFYGFKYALGGIVALKGSDFEATNGYPNFWGWGMEDNVLQSRCEKIGLKIDRSQFFPIGSPNILHLFDGVTRVINMKDPWRATHDNGLDGLRTIHKLAYDVSSESVNPLDNVHVVFSDKIFVVNISTFMTGTRFEHDNYAKYDLREPPRKIIHPDKIKTHKIDHLTDDWSHIPFYPTMEKKKEMVNQYGEKKANEIIEYSYNNSTDPTREVVPPHLEERLDTSLECDQSKCDQSKCDQSKYNHQAQLNIIQKYNQALQVINANQRIIPPNVNKYSPEYARIIGAKPRATTSASIRLGGVYR
jgi:hypothetical protein